MDNEIHLSVDFIQQLKSEILKSRYIVAKIANAESLRLYFNIGRIVDKSIRDKQWGSKVLDTISTQLQQELPGLRGFSGKNLSKMRSFYLAWKDSSLIDSLLTSQLEKQTSNTLSSSVTSKIYDNTFEVSKKEFFSVSFTHHYEIILKIKDENSRWYYINLTATQFLTVQQLRHELQNNSHLQELKLPNNFQQTLPEVLSNKALRAFKDQYLLDFVTIEDADGEIDEKIVEQGIVNNIKKYLMSLGTDFSFMGNQFRLIVSEEEYFIDLLFFHRGLQSLVAFELKKGKFKPEYVGKMNFYLSALDDLVKQPHENASIGIILCKEKDNKKVEYSFRDVNKPMGVSTYITSEDLPEKYRTVLPDSETLMKLLDETDF